MDDGAKKCSQCGTSPLDEGYLEDGGHASGGYGRWIGGPLQRGLFGPRRLGKQRWVIEAFRCPSCGHLELYAQPEPGRRVRATS